MEERTGLDGFLDQAGSQTAGADTDAQGRTIHKRLHALQVGIKDPLGLIVGVADVISGLVFFSAEITSKCHGPTPLLRRRSTAGPLMRGDATIASPAMTSLRGRVLIAGRALAVKRSRYSAWIT